MHCITVVRVHSVRNAVALVVGRVDPRAHDPLRARGEEVEVVQRSVDRVAFVTWSTSRAASVIYACSEAIASESMRAG